MLEDEYDAEWALRVNKDITHFVTTPMAIIGDVLNILVIVAWRKCSSSCTYVVSLFKILAGVDMIFMTGFCVWYYIPDVSPAKPVAIIIAFTARNTLVNINLLMAVIRWLAVRFPIKFRSNYRDFYTRLALAIIVSYCAISQVVLEVLSTFEVYSRRTTIVIQVTLDQACLSFPLVLQAAFSAHMVWLTWKVTRHKAHNTELRSALSTEDQRKAMAIDYGRNRQLTSIVVSITVVTFLAYPVSTSVSTYFKLAPSAPKKSSKRVVFAVINLLAVFNSSINFFIYCLFFPGFRRSLRQQLHCSPVENVTSRTSESRQTSRMTTPESNVLRVISREKTAENVEQQNTVNTAQSNAL